MEDEMMEKEIEMMKKRGLAELEALENMQKSQVESNFIRPLATTDHSPTYPGDRFSESASYLALGFSFIALLFAFYGVVYPTGKGKSESGFAGTGLPVKLPQVEGNLNDLNTFRKVTEEELAKVHENLTHLSTVYQETTKQLNALQPQLHSLTELSNRLDLVRGQLIQIQTQLDQITSDIRTEQLKNALLQAKLDTHAHISYQTLLSRLQEIKQMTVQSHLPDKERVVENIDAVLAKVDQGEGSVISKLEKVLNQMDTVFEMK